MSVERRRCRGLAVAMLLWLLASRAVAGELLEQVLTPFVDPLFVAPPVLESGVILPGDHEAVVCPEGLPPNAQRLGLAEAIDLALCHNPQIRSAWAEIRVQAGALGEARAAFLPTINASMSRLTDNTRYPESSTDSSSISSNTQYANLNWRLLDFGGRLANHRAAAALLEAAMYSHDATIQKTLASVIGAYFDAQTAYASKLAKGKGAEHADQALLIARRKEAKGAGSHSDVLQAATAAAKAALEKSRAEGEYRKTISVLLFSAGLPQDFVFELPEEVQDQVQVLEGELDAWLELSKKNHPQIAAARAKLMAARERAKASLSEGAPTLDFVSSYYQNGRPNQGLTATRTEEMLTGFTLNIPLFDGFSRTYKVRGAQALVEQREADFRDVEGQVTLELVKSHADASSALANLAQSLNLLEAAEKGLEVMQRRYAKGAADMLEILNAQTALADAWQERIRCLAEWRSSRLKLLASAGSLGRFKGWGGR